MRIMLDTNILVSAIFFPSPQTKAIITEIVCHHQMILCDYVLEELRLVVERKFPSKSTELEYFFHTLRFELIHVSDNADCKDIPSVRDQKDTPILAAAIQHTVDIFITGDKDFLVLDVDRSQIMNMTEFSLRYI